MFDGFFFYTKMLFYLKLRKFSLRFSTPYMKSVKKPSHFGISVFGFLLTLADAGDCRLWPHHYLAVIGLLTAPLIYIPNY